MYKNLSKVRKIVDRAKKRYLENRQPQIKVGFIGCGRHASENLYPALHYASLNLVATCAKHLKNAERNALRFGAPSAYDDYRQLIDNEQIDGLVVCVNPQLHYQICLDSLKKDIPVFVEKPPALNYMQAKEMSQLSRVKDKFLMVGFNKRFGVIYREAKRIIESSGFGGLTSIYMSCNVGETKDESSLLYESGIHYFDLLRYFAGELKDFQVKKNCRSGKAALMISLEFQNGIIGGLQLSNFFSWSKPSEYIELVGEQGRVILENSQNIVYHRPTIASPG